MNLIDVLSAPWAIVPGKLEEIHAIAAAHARGERRDIAAIEAQIGRPLSNQQRPVQVVDGVAVVGLSGVLAKRMNLMTQVSGGTSTQLAAQELQSAIDDPAVRAIVLAIDSPGGTVDGTEAFANIVRAGAQQKRILALADGCMASAAYWIGAAVGPGNIYLAERTTQVGSIGVVAKHVDQSGAEARAGVKTTEITAGKFKRIASGYAPLTEDGRNTIQSQVDFLYGLFVESVAKDRGVSAERVLQRMADGRVFTGQQAIDAGLADGFSTMNSLIRIARGNPAPRVPSRSPSSSISAKETPMGYNATSFSDTDLRRVYGNHSHLQRRYGSVDAYIADMSAKSAKTISPLTASDTDWAAVHRQATALVESHGIEYVVAVKRVLAEGVR